MRVPFALTLPRIVVFSPAIVLLSGLRFPYVEKRMDGDAEELAATKSEVSLASLALLITFDKESKLDYIDYLTPFVIEIFRTDASQGITRQNILEAFKSRFGLYIPLQPLELSLKRLVNKHVLRVSPVYGGIYSPGSKYPSNGRRLNEEKQVCLSDIRGVMAELMRFAASSYNVTWSAEQATDAVTGYLANYAIDCLKACFGKSTIAIVERVKECDFIVNAFIRSVLEAGGELSEKLVTLVKAQMLANALLCPDIGMDSRDFSKVTLFLDTPLVLRLLDLDTEPAHAAAAETLDLCRHLGSRIAIFPHTATETFGVIKGCATYLDDSKFARGRLIREMRSRGTSAQELLLIADGLDACLQNLRIEVIETPPHDPKYEISEIQLDSALDEDIKYLHTRARQYDIDSIRAIYTLRAGKAPRTLETCKAVLVTTNSKLARTAFQFGQKFENSREVSTVVSSFGIANLAWLKGGSLSSTLPKAEMLSLAYAALQPSNAIWEKFIKVQEEMRQKGAGTPAQHAVLRYSAQTQKNLMNLTLGDEERITSKTIHDLIEEAELEIVKHERELRAKEGANYREEMSAREVEIANAISEKEQLIVGLEQIIDERRLARQEVAKLAARLGTIVSWLCVLPSIGLVVAAWEIDKIIPANWAVKHIAAAFASFLLLCLTVWGISPIGWSRRLGKNFEEWLISYIGRKYFPPVQLAMDQKMLEQQFNWRGNTTTRNLE
jgi:hypothetical protein